MKKMNAGVRWRGRAASISICRRLVVVFGLTCAPVSMLVAGVASAQAPPFQLQWGTPGNGDGQFRLSDVAGIALDAAGNVYVCDNGNYRVQKFDSNGGFLLKWGPNSFLLPDIFSLGTPNAMAVDDSGFVYTAQFGGRIQKFTSNGNLITEWGDIGSGNGEFRYCYGIAIAGTTLYATDRDNRRIQMFTTSGTFLGAWGIGGTAPGQLAAPYDVAVEAGGTVLVVDALFAPRVQRFTSTGQHLLTIGSAGTGDGQFSEPIKIAVGPNGYIYVSDSGNHRIQVFSPSGAFLTKWGGGPSNAPGFFDYPEGIAVNPFGDVYVLDHQNFRIQKFGPVTPTRTTTWGRLKSLYK